LPSAPLPAAPLPPAPLPAATLPPAPVESRRARRDMIWETPSQDDTAGQESVTDRVSIWNRSAAAAESHRSQQEQGALFQAAPVEDAFGQPEGAPQAVEPPPEPAPPRSRSGNKRSSVPSWDEIVFGASRTDT
jgi:hypothetical protein